MYHQKKNCSVTSSYESSQKNYAARSTPRLTPIARKKERNRMHINSRRIIWTIPRWKHKCCVSIASVEKESTRSTRAPSSSSSSARIGARFLHVTSSSQSKSSRGPGRSPAANQRCMYVGVPPPTRLPRPAARSHTSPDKLLPYGAPTCRDRPLDRSSYHSSAHKWRCLSSDHQKNSLSYPTFNTSSSCCRPRVRCVGVGPCITSEEEQLCVHSLSPPPIRH